MAHNVRYYRSWLINMGIGRIKLEPVGKIKALYCVFQSRTRDGTESYAQSSHIAIPSDLQMYDRSDRTVYYTPLSAISLKSESAEFV